MKKHPSDHVSVEVGAPGFKPRELTAYEIKMAKIAAEETRRLEKERNTWRFKWTSQSVQVIKDKLEARKEKNLYGGNDWKVKFYEDKLKLIPNILQKLSRLI